jgi:crotonobetainyl-CoA:carnitine CoA-transferase CaiB-like acyl-CoA transferase
MMSLTGTPESGPLKTGSTVIDYTTGYVAAFAIAGALFHRSRTGVGQAIDLAMLEVAMSLMSNEVTRAVTSGEQPSLHGNASGVGRYVSNSFRCKEGVIMVAARSQNLRARFWKSIDREDIPRDPRFATDALARRNMKELEAEVQKTLATRTAREWQDKFNRDGVPAMEVLSLLEAIEDPHIAARGFIKRFEADPEAGLPAYGMPTMPYRLSETPAAITRRAPRLGEDTDAILSELGLSRRSDSRPAREEDRIGGTPSSSLHPGCRISACGAGIEMHDMDPDAGMGEHPALPVFMYRAKSFPGGTTTCASIV